MEKFKLSDRVKVIGKNANGKVAFIGETQFTEGVMFGICLDEPKGRHGGTIGGIQYFKCPKNQGVFVRQCQLEKENEAATDDCGKLSKVTSERHAYPNYLRHSLKSNLERPKGFTKNKEVFPKPQTKQPDTTTRQLPEPKQFQKQAESNHTTGGSRLSRMKLKKSEQQLQELSQKLSEANDQVKLLITELSKRNHQVSAFQRDLKKLKAYLRWNKECEDTNNVKDHRIKNFLSLIVNSVIENMEDTLIKVDMKKWSDFSEGNPEMVEKSTLLQHIWNLEKENKSLREFLRQITDFIMTSRKNPSSRVKSKCRGGNKKCNENSTNDSVEYLSEQLLNCDLKKHTEPNYQSAASETKSFKKEKSQHYTHKLKESCVRKYLETLDPDLGKMEQVNDCYLNNDIEKTNNPNQQSNSSKLSFGKSKKFQTPLVSDSNNKNFNVDDSCLDPVPLSTKGQFRSLPYNLAERCNQREKIIPKSELLSSDQNNAIKELHDLISNIMSNVSETCESDIEDFQEPVIKQTQDGKAKGKNLTRSLTSLYSNPERPEKIFSLSSKSKFTERENLSDLISNIASNVPEACESEIEDLNVAMPRQDQDQKVEERDPTRSLTSVRLDPDRLEKMSTLSSKSKSAESLKTSKSDFAGGARRKDNLRKRMIYSHRKIAKKP